MPDLRAGRCRDGSRVMPAPVAAAGSAVLKGAAWAIARRQSKSLVGRFWKVIAVISLMLVVAPIGMVIVTFVALSESISAGPARAVAGPLAPMLCPVPGAVLTQGFGPTAVVLEPPGFGYPHFHTGLDL